MTSEQPEVCVSCSGDWSILDVPKRPDDNQSDIEVISNPSTIDPDIVIMDDEPRLLYSEMLMKKPDPVTESDIEFVPDPDLEYDDEDYLDEIVRSTRMSPAGSDLGSRSQSDSEDECVIPSNVHEMKPAMTQEEVDSREVILEVNLTLLSFTIIVGVSGMSGFLLGGIYSAVLTNNISHNTALAEYPGTLPNFLYSDSVTCPHSDCESKLYRIEENMKQLKETMSHDVRTCHGSLASLTIQNAALHSTNKHTAAYASQRCSAAGHEVQALQAKSADLLAELEEQRQAFKSLKDRSNTEAARNVVQIASLAQTLENTRVDLNKARDAVSILDNINADCRKNVMLSSFTSSKAVDAAKRESEESTLWKTLYKQAIIDLEAAEKKVTELEKSLNEETENVREADSAAQSARVSYFKERSSKKYFKSLVEKYIDLLEVVEKKLSKAKYQQRQLGQEFESLKYLTTEMEFNLESCSNTTVRAEQRAQHAIKSKQYVESVLMNKISGDKEKYRALKLMYKDQEKVIAEMETQRSALEESLVRKIASNRKKFLLAKSKLENTLRAYGASKEDTSATYEILKSKVGKSRERRNLVQEELEQSKAVIAQYQAQLDLFESYVQQIEDKLKQLREDVVMREAIQREYIALKERQHEAEISAIHASYNLSSQRTEEFNNLQKRHDRMIEKLGEEESAKQYWMDAAKFQKHQADRFVNELKSCNSGKVTAVAEVTRTTELLLDIIHDVASKPKCESPSLNTVLYDQPTFTPFPPKSMTSPITAPLYALSVVPDVMGPSEIDQVHRRLKNSTGENFTLLSELYNTTTPETDLDVCYASLSPLFPGVHQARLGDVINMTQSRDEKLRRKMSTALSKYWGGVDKAYNILYEKYVRDRDDDDDDDDDWYFKRFGAVHDNLHYNGIDNDWYMKRFKAADKGLYPKGPAKHTKMSKADSDWFMDRKKRKGESQYSYVNKKSGGSRKGDFDCHLFDCLSPSSSRTGLELCGC